MKTEEDRRREAEFYQSEGRKARLAGKAIADMPYFPHIGPRPLLYVSSGAEWIKGWREAGEV